jgi:hypothetical protein
LTNASRFTDEIRDAVTDRRNLKTAFDDFYFDQVQPNEDGGFTVIAEAAKTSSNRNAFSRWDYFWGGPFYNPFIFSYWNRPFGFYPWSRFGWGMMRPWGWGPGWGLGWGWGWNSWMMQPFGGFGYPSVTYTAGKVAILKFDAKANIQSVKTIDKKQSDMNVDQFIGYGQIQNSAGTNFLYFNKTKGVRQIVHQQLNTSGNIVTGSPIVLNEKQLEWMPRSLKQVGEKEAILPYQSKGKLGFAKITIQ